MAGPNDPIEPAPDNETAADATKSAVEMSAAYREAVNAAAAITNEQALQLANAKSFAELLATVDGTYRKIGDAAFKVSAEERRHTTLLKEQMSDASTRFRDVQKYFDAYSAYTQKLNDENKLAKDTITLAAKKLGYSEKETDTVLKRYEAMQKIEKLSVAFAAVSSGVAATIQGIDKIADIGFQSQMAGTKGRAFGLMQGAGMAPSGPGAAMTESNRMFGMTGAAMGPDERVAAYSKILTEFPKAAGESSDSMTTLIGALGYFGLNVDEATASLIRGGKDAGLNAEQVAQSYRAASVVAKNLGLSTKETGAELLGLTTSIRAAGGTSAQAQNIMKMFSGDIVSMGQSLTAVEKLNLGKMFAGIASMPVDKILGLTMFATGKSLQSVGPQDLEKGAIFGTAKATWDKISSSVGGSYAEQLVATQKIGQLLGINISSARDVSALQQVMDKKLSSEDFEKEIDMLANPAMVTAKGMEALKIAVDPLKSIDNTAKDIRNIMSPLGAFMQSFPQLIGAAKVAMPVASTAMSTLQAAPTLIAGYGWLAGTELGAAAIGLATGPVGWTAAGATALVASAYAVGNMYVNSQHNMEH